MNDATISTIETNPSNFILSGDNDKSSITLGLENTFFMVQPLDDFVIKFGPNGTVEIGESYRDHPDEGVRKFFETMFEFMDKNDRFDDFARSRGYVLKTETEGAG